MISHRLCSLLLLVAVALGQPTPLYWEVNPDYILPIDSAKAFADQGVAPNNVSSTVTETLIKYTYSLTSISGKATFDGDNRSVYTIALSQFSLSRYHHRE